ncbi:DUF1998 domain-containing protein [Smaragdicoccus niigatensis]|nr:DUF1998 domain-containing protein [Smaragdicoccus niigatensis]
MVLRKTLSSKKPPVKTTVRRSQMITTYGVGALVPVESESFIVAGLDHWNPRPEDLIEEPRLSRSLGVSGLYLPPGNSSRGMVPIARFPEWVYCPQCSRLEKFWRIADKLSDRYINRCRHCVTSRLVPSRFVACCADGHIQDFPYVHWTHRGHERTEGEAHSLKITVDPSNSTLAGIRLACSCGAKRTLEGALGSGSLSLSCAGASPWLDGTRDSCKAQLVGLQRGASNVWFGDVRSAITVDRTLSPVEEVLEKILPELVGALADDVALLIGIKARQHNVNQDELIAAYRRLGSASFSGAEAYREIRSAEYEALGREHPEITGAETFVSEPKRVSPTGEVGRVVDVVSRVARLREVRALTGFSRVAPSEGAGSAPKGALSRGRHDWLPAIEVLGEGVFIRLREEEVASWEGSEFATTRAQKLQRAMQAAASKQAGEVPPVSPRVLLLHSLSHSLLNELALDTGYPASSIRERLYAENGQSGILLYTATADAAGSLGGLCSKGTPTSVEKLVTSALERALWCSADPVCLESASTGAGAANLAACHSCLLVPEVSCELQNRLLDRACLIGVGGDGAGGFLTSRVSGSLL